MTKFAFGLMAVLLVGIGIFAYLQQVERIKLEARIEAGLLPHAAGSAGVGPAGAVAPNQANALAPAPVNQEVAHAAAVAATPSATASPVAPGAVPTTAKDEEIANLKEELDARRAEEKALDGKLKEMTAEINRREAKDLQKEKEGKDQLSPLQQKIQLAPAVGKLQEFKPEWAFGVIDAGSEQGINVGDSFALRQGADLVAVIKVSEVQADRSVCDIVPQTVSRGLMPAVGDDVINMPPY